MENNKHAHHLREFKKRFIVSTLLTIPIIGYSPLIAPYLALPTFPQYEYLIWCLGTSIYLYGGWPFLRGMYHELRSLTPGMMTLIGCATTVSYLYSTSTTFFISGSSFYAELATLIDIMLLGHWIEMKSVMGAHRSSLTLSKLLPSIVHRVDQSQTIDVPLDEIKAQDVLKVKPGEKIPADGTVIEGASHVNEGTLTGEPTPVSKSVGDSVAAGTLNTLGSFTMRVEKPGHASYIATLISTVEQTLATKTATQRVADRAAFWLTIIALLAGTITFIVWLLLGQSLVFSLERMITVFIVTCPHALGLAIPLVIARATHLAGMNGILIRNLAALESAHSIDIVAFDKTGTLTNASFQITDLLPTASSKLTVDQLLQLAASVEANSEHPIAQAVVAEAHKKNVPLLQALKFCAVQGRGAQASVEGKNVMLSSTAYAEEQSIKLPTELRTQIQNLSSDGKTVVVVVIDNEAQGLIGLGDLIRPEAAAVITQLDKLKRNTLMITGDDAQTAEAVALQVGIKNVEAELTPEQKQEIITTLQTEGNIVCMVGDGINDAAALAEASIGCAVGAASDITKETGDIVLVHNNLVALPLLIKLSIKLRTKIIQNLVWALGYNIFMIPLAAGVLSPFHITLPPALGAIIMSVSTVIVAINSQLLTVDEQIKAP